VVVGFWTLNHPAKKTAVITDDGRALTYLELRDCCDRFAESIHTSRKTLGFVLCRNTPECLAAYLGALRSDNAVALLDAELKPKLLKHLLETYIPDWIFSPEPIEVSDYDSREISGGFLYVRSTGISEISISHELALLLPTSGSTGSSKFVRLAERNLQANARSIVGYLGIDEEDICISSLPMPYSYGLSVLHTHLLAGGQLLMTTASFLQREFWTFFGQRRPTSLAGVPYHYEVMLRMGLLERELPGLRTLTQAGGPLAPEKIAQLEKISALRGWRFFVMYGQTEATARIAYVPPDRLLEKVGSIGIAIPEGRLSLDSETGELLYSGPNVMLGYAETRDDLTKGDELNANLRTGDLCKQDDDGFFYLVGRLRRFLKIFGKRFSLDEMESLLSRETGFTVACFGVDDLVSIAIDTPTTELVVAQVMKDTLKVHPSAFRIVKLDSLPRLANGKLDYQFLANLEGR
jgi:acyl-CoA synthetase (AMP-forming)/AMP-acid ligase II